MLGETGAPEELLGMFYRVVVETFPEGLMMVDEIGTILVANPAAERLFGYEPGDLVGRRVDTLVSEELRPVHAGHRAVFASAAEWHPMQNRSVLVARRRDGSAVRVCISLNPASDAVGSQFVIAVVRGAEHQRN